MTYDSELYDLLEPTIRKFFSGTGPLEQTLLYDYLDSVLAFRDANAIEPVDISSLLQQIVHSEFSHFFWFKNFEDQQAINTTLHLTGRYRLNTDIIWLSNGNDALLCKLRFAGILFCNNTHHELISLKNYLNKYFYWKSDEFEIQNN